MPSPKPKSIVIDKTLTFEKVWAMVQETNRKADMRMKETDRQMRETDRQMRETDRQMKETGQRMKETERMVKEVSRQMGLLNNRFGELAEHLVAPSIEEKFNELGFKFTGCFKNYKLRENVNSDVYTEVDLMLENGSIAIAIEVKAKVKQADVNEHLERMKLVRRKADLRGDKRKFQGAIAGAIMDKSTRSYALGKGLYVIVQAGDTVKIDIPPGFKPREW